MNVDQLSSSPHSQKKMIKFENWQVSVFVFEQAGSSLTDMAITVRNTQRLFLHSVYPRVVHQYLQLLKKSLKGLMCLAVQ